MQARPFERPRAVLFDLDGTLYDQRPLRHRMLFELLGRVVTSPVRGARVMRHLKVFREVREQLRALGDSAPSLDEVQYSEPAGRIQVAPDALEETVTEWMYERPLRHLKKRGKAELRSTLEILKRAGLGLGVFSDYPPEAKLRALGVDDLFEVSLSATDAEINAFKPHPRGFEYGASALGFECSEVIYVGDRADVDGGGAAAAGMRCVLVGVSGEAPGPDVRHVQKFEEVAEAIGCA